VQTCTFSQFLLSKGTGRKALIQRRPDTIFTTAVNSTDAVPDLVANQSHEAKSDRRFAANQT